MQLYIMCILDTIMVVFLIGMCVQIIRIEKALLRYRFFIENKVSKILRPEK